MSACSQQQMDARLAASMNAMSGQSLLAGGLGPQQQQMNALPANHMTALGQQLGAAMSGVAAGAAGAQNAAAYGSTRDTTEYNLRSKYESDLQDLPIDSAWVAAGVLVGGTVLVLSTASLIANWATAGRPFMIIMAALATFFTGWFLVYKFMRRRLALKYAEKLMLAK